MHAESEKASINLQSALLKDQNKPAKLKAFLFQRSKAQRVKGMVTGTFLQLCFNDRNIIYKPSCIPKTTVRVHCLKAFFTPPVCLFFFFPDVSLPATFKRLGLSLIPC